MNQVIFNQVHPLPEKSREAWVVDAARLLANEFIAKYIAGQQEHGGDLGHVPTTMLLSHLEQEALDALAYAREIRRRMLGPMDRDKMIQKIESIIQEERTYLMAGGIARDVAIKIYESI